MLSFPFGYSLNFDPLQGCILIAAISFALAAISLLRNDPVDHNTNHVQKVKLFFNRASHWFAIIVICFYIFIFKRTYILDGIFLAIIIITYLQRQFFKECIIVINEKQIMNPDYIPGSDILFEPWIIATLGIDSIANIAGVFQILNIIIVASSLFKTAKF